MKKTILSLLALAVASSMVLPVRAQEPERATTETVAEPVSTTNEAVDAESAETNKPSSAVLTEALPRGIRIKPDPSRGSARNEPIVVIGDSYVLKSGESAETVVVIGGSAQIHGKVAEDVVVIGGSITVDGEVGGDAVAVLGGITLLDEAKIAGDAVAVGGKVDVGENSSVGGTRQGINLGLTGVTAPEWLKVWFKQCVLKMRPMAPQVGWLWAFTGIMFLVYLLIAAVFPRPVQACVEELTRRPATTFLMGLLTKLLLPLVFLILAATGVGLFVIPFIMAGLFLGVMVGKVALFEVLGRALAKTTGSTLQRPILAFVIGFIIILILYMVPVLGLLTLILVSLWGLGAGVLAAFSGLRKETDKSPPTLARAVPISPLAPMPVTPLAPGASPDMTKPIEPALAFETPTGAIAPEPPRIAQQEAAVFPRAGFWERMGAAFLDVVLVSILGAWVGGPPFGFLVALAYFAGMWTWKGTTVGGIVLGLKVVRLDGGPLTFTVALVRALGAAFSVVVLFLGFLWIAWDSEKQGWHDRIAGTVVVKLPRGTSLVCF